MKLKSQFYVYAILLLVIATITLNQIEKQSIDQSKLPEKVEDSRGFQRWITNLKNKDFEIEADEFLLLEENEIYNTKWVKISSIDQKGKQEEYDKTLEEVKDFKKVVFSPSERQFIDYRDEVRRGYKSNEVNVYGLREDKIVDARVVDCSLDANCYFDRAYFLEDSNDVLVVSEFSRDIDKKAENIEPCTADELCTYTIKLHVIDMLQNSRLVYESLPFDIILNETKPDL
jgi:hypothetical protein